MQIPDYFLPRPNLDLSSEKAQSFDDLYNQMAAVPGQTIDYSLPYPKWQFLCYLGEAHDVVFHGSQNNEISILEPRQPKDIQEFSNQLAIYGTDDGIWSMFFAILDRQKYRMSLFNSCARVRLASGQLSEPVYFFSITADALARSPWFNGMIYILPRTNFVQQPPQPYQGMEIVLSHWVCHLATRPIAQLRVGPMDFPFLSQIRGHDDEVLFARAKANPDGFPWMDEE
jgi:hypothetical protein